MHIEGNKLTTYLRTSLFATWEAMNPAAPVINTFFGVYCDIVTAAETSALLLPFPQPSDNKQQPSADLLDQLLLSLCLAKLYGPSAPCSLGDSSKAGAAHLRPRDLLQWRQTGDRASFSKQSGGFPTRQCTGFCGIWWQLPSVG